jgi:hypothetical protein
MADGQAFLPKLESALEAKRAHLDRTELPRLKESWKLFQIAFHGIGSVLLKKGIIHEDPYKYELKIAEVNNPSEGPFAESERIDQMSVRISQFEAYVEFLNNYYQFDCDFITLGRIKRLLGLVKYFNFTQFTDTNTSPNTRILAELCNAVRKGSDQMSAGIIGEAIGQLERATRDILAVLKTLSEFQREAYKLEVRELVLPGLGLDAALVATRREDATRKIKQKFAEVAGDRPFYPELVDEILNEDFGADHEALVAAIFAKLAVVEEKKTEKGQAKSYKVILLEGIRILAGTSSQLEDAIIKLSENSAFIEAQNKGFLSQLAKMFKRLFSPGERGLHYEVDIVESVTGERKTESIDFPAFVEEGTRKARLLASLLQRQGPTMKRLDGAPDDHVFKFLERNIEELQRIVKRLNAIEDHLRAIFPAAEKTRFKGIKSDITTIKNCIIKANQKKHEYHAQKEEEEQLRRLGVNSD